MNIGDVAERTGLPAKTIRYYEEIGLVRPLRGENGYRRFRESDVHKLGFLGRARSLGFSIEDCRGLLALYEDEGRAITAPIARSSPISRWPTGRRGAEAARRRRACALRPKAE